MIWGQGTREDFGMRGSIICSTWNIPICCLHTKIGDTSDSSGSGFQQPMAKDRIPKLTAQTPDHPHPIYSKKNPLRKNERDKNIIMFFFYFQLI